jgi:CRISPR-associated protein Cas1
MKKNYYITSNGTLKRMDNTIILKTLEDTKRIPVHNVNGISILSQVDLNTRVHTFLSKQEIPAHYYDWFGYYRGTYYPKETLNSGNVVVRQAEHYLSQEKRLTLAREIMLGSAHNMLQNLKYYLSKGKDIDSTVGEIKELIQQGKSAERVNQVMGTEGKIRELYYSCFPVILRNFAFDKRVKRPPNNEMNALISFGNSLLYTATLNEIYRTYLNPTISFLHEPGERRFSLSLDISDVFKPVFVDKTVFKLVNKQIIQKKHFEKELNNCLLNQQGRKKVIQEFEARLEKTSLHERLGRNVSNQRRLRLEGYKLIKHVMRDETYESYKT